MTPVTPMAVRVPATSANLGPGFDCLGLAVGLWLEVSITPASRDGLSYRGEGRVPDTPDSLIHQGFRSVYRALGRPPPTVHFDVNNPIPLARGLGSSSAALVAGAALADAGLRGVLGRDGVFGLTAKMEGHPDNVAPAVYGGFTVSASTPGGYLCESLLVPERWTFLFAVPDFELLTSESRAVLPVLYGREDAVFNASRSALWTAAVALDKPELLPVAARDALHEPYREGLIPGFAALRERLRGAWTSPPTFRARGRRWGRCVRTLSDGTERCRKAHARFCGGAGEGVRTSGERGLQFRRGCLEGNCGSVRVKELLDCPQHLETRVRRQSVRSPSKRRVRVRKGAPCSPPA